MSEATGYIELNSSPGECDEALDRIRDLLKSARVKIPNQATDGFIVSETAPGPNDRGKLWLKVDGSGAYWYKWSTDCGKWCPIDGVPGEIVTRYRIEETVAEDIAAYHGCGWELAAGENLLEVDRRGFSAGALGEYALIMGDPQYCVASITVVDGDDDQTVYSNLSSGANHADLPSLVAQLNDKFATESYPLTATIGNNGLLSITHDDEDYTVIGAVDCRGSALIPS